MNVNKRISQMTSRIQAAKDHKSSVERESEENKQDDAYDEMRQQIEDKYEAEIATAEMRRTKGLSELDNQIVANQKKLDADVVKATRELRKLHNALVPLEARKQALTRTLEMESDTAPIPVALAAAPLPSIVQDAASTVPPGVVTQSSVATSVAQAALVAQPSVAQASAQDQDLSLVKTIAELQEKLGIRYGLGEPLTKLSDVVVRLRWTRDKTVNELQFLKRMGYDRSKAWVDLLQEKLPGDPLWQEYHTGGYDMVVEKEGTRKCVFLYRFAMYVGLEVNIDLHTETIKSAKKRPAGVPAVDDAQEFDGMETASRRKRVRT